MNLSAATDLSSLCVEYNSISLFFTKALINLLQNSLLLSTHILFGLRFDSFNFFGKH